MMVALMTKNMEGDKYSVMIPITLIGIPAFLPATYVQCFAYVKGMIGLI